VLVATIPFLALPRSNVPCCIRAMLLARACSIFALLVSGYAVGCQSLTGATTRTRRLVTRLAGGYDATIVNPNLPIEFYTLKGGMCPYAARTLMVLHELGLAFETIEIAHSPKPDWYLNINPRGKVPAIRIPADGNAVVYESAICDEYLCDYYEHSREDGDDDESRQTLLPRAPSVRARMRLLNDHYDTVVGKAQFTYLMHQTSEEEDGNTEHELAEALNQSLNVYETALADSGGPYLLGADFTLADVHLAPFFVRLVVSLRHFKRYEVDPVRFPRLLAWYERCATRTSVQAAAPTAERIVEVYKMFVERDYAFGGLNKNKKE
jgi:glutathione S-transferase